MTNTYKPNKYKASCGECGVRQHQPKQVTTYDYPNMQDFKFGDTVRTICANCLVRKVGNTVTIMTHEERYGK